VTTRLILGLFMGFVSCVVGFDFRVSFFNSKKHKEL